MQTSARPRPRFVDWPISRLKHFDRNPRVHPEHQIESLVASIHRFGFLPPPIVDEKSGTILVGNARVIAAARAGYTKIPVALVGHLDKREQLAFVIADNQLALQADWDRLLLSEYIALLEDEGFERAALGFPDDEFEELLAEARARDLPEEEPPLPEVPPKPVSRRGDVWNLGSHRVMCGDSTSIEDLQLLTGRQPVDAVWTDPPYNVNYEGKAGRLENDGITPAAFNAMLAGAFAGMFHALRPGGPIYVSHATTAQADFMTAFLEAGFRHSAHLVWVKNVLVLGRGDYHYRHEPILYGWKPGARHRWNGASNQTSVIEFDEPPFVQVGESEWQITVGERTLIVRGQGVTIEAARGSVFLENKPMVNREHPTMKPVPLIERMLRNSARAGQVVLDPFGGSGSTLIACQRLGMKARLMELSPGYADVIVNRWQNLTGGQAVHAGTKKPFGKGSRSTSKAA